MMKETKTVLLLLLFFFFTLSIPSSLAVYFKAGVHFRASATDTIWLLGADFNFSSVQIDDTYLIVEKIYVSSPVEYVTWVGSPSNVRFTLHEWFPTANSSAHIELTSPSSTNVTFYVLCTCWTDAYCEGAVSYSWDFGTRTLTVVMNTASSSDLYIYADIYEGVENWLEGWKYRKSHVINSATGAGTNYQIQITAYYASGADSGKNVYLNSHSQTDFDDVRFTASDGDSLLTYFRESKVDGSYANFWVKVSADLSASAQTIYIYYGNPTVSTTSSADSTFGFYDHFLGTSLNTTKWNQVDTDGQFTWSVHDSRIDVINTKYDSIGERFGFHHTGVPYQDNFGIYIQDLYTFCGSGETGDDPIFAWGFVLTNESTPWNAEICAMFYDAWVGNYPKKYARIGTQIYTSSNLGNENTAQVVITKVNGNVSVIFDGVVVLNAITNKYLTSLFIVATCQQEIFQDHPFPNHATINMIRVRKYVDPEPSHGAWGAEEFIVEATFYFTELGTFYVNGSSQSNGTSLWYEQNTVLNLTGVADENCHFINFTWDSQHTAANPYFLTITSDLTIWCYFTGDSCITFYKNDGILKVNGVPKSNGTIMQFSFGTVITLEGSGWTKYYSFGNWTLSYGGHSYSNPWLHNVTYSGNYTIWLYNKWDPASYPPELPSTPSALQYLINGNYLGFIQSIFTSLMGEMFYALLMVAVYFAVYLRLKSVVLPLLMWFLMGGLWIALVPSISNFVFLFFVLGIGGGVLFALFNRGSEN